MENQTHQPSVPWLQKMKRVMLVAECLTLRWKCVNPSDCRKKWKPSKMKSFEEVMNSPEETKRTNLFSWGKSGQQICSSSAYSPILHTNFAFTDLSHRKQEPWYITAHKTLWQNAVCLFICGQNIPSCPYQFHHTNIAHSSMSS